MASKHTIDFTSLAFPGKTGKGKTYWGWGWEQISHFILVWHRHEETHYTYLPQPLIKLFYTQKGKSSGFYNVTGTVG
jgi:hypothetical protein